MLFNSAIFLLGFLPVTYLVFWQLRSKNARYIWLAFTGYVFYGYWNPKFCLLMAFSTLVSYTAGLGFLRWDHDQRKRKLLLIVPITVDLLLLGFFKYTNFLLDNLNSILAWADRPTFPLMNIILPIGISFYTFHTITYIVDCYRRVIVPTRNIFEFSCYVSLFSQLVAGPIVRFRELQEDLEGIDRKDRQEGLDRGWSFFILGLAQKIIIADTIAAVVNPGLKNAENLSTAGAWLCMIGYTYQLYFDFAGYSNMAVGLGHLFGMHIPQNFDSPYRAVNPSDFWRRWHISLSRCLRDYLYNPIAFAITRRRVAAGKSVSRKALATLPGFTAMIAVPTMATMLLGGLWHGAQWTFVVWGGYQGLLLVLYQRYSRQWDATPVWAQRAGTFILVIFGWTLFRAETWHQAAVLFNRMLIPQAGVLPVAWATLVVFIIIAAGIAHFGPNTFQIGHRWTPAQAFGLTVVFVICLVRVYGAEDSPFLYFQF